MNIILKRWGANKEYCPMCGSPDCTVDKTIRNGYKQPVTFGHCFTCQHTEYETDFEPVTNHA